MNSNRPVIVLLKDQFASAAAGSAAVATRAAEVAANEDPVVSELTDAQATHIRRFQIVDARAATVSPAEQAQLAADPGVAEVIPDEVVRLAAPTPAVPVSTAPKTTPPVPAVVPGACTTSRNSTRRGWG